jgi:hypothetical protein
MVATWYLIAFPRAAIATLRLRARAYRSTSTAGRPEGSSEGDEVGERRQRLGHILARLGEEVAAEVRPAQSAGGARSWLRSPLHDRASSSRALVAT